MSLFWFLVLPSMLASESRMVVHVAVGTVCSRVLTVLPIKFEDMLDPLDIDDLLLWRELICLSNWTWNCWAIWIEAVVTSINWSEIFPWKAFLCWISTFCWIDRNRLASLGRTLGRGSGPFGVTAFFPCPCILGGLHGLGIPAVELFDTCSPPWIVMEPNHFNHASVQIRHVHKAFAILLWTDDILLVSLVGW